MPRFRNVPIFYVCERGTGRENANTSNLLLRKFRGQLYAISQKDDGHFGWVTSKAKKINYVGLARARLREQSVWFHSPVYCSGDAEAQCNKLGDQLSRFREVVLPSLSPGQPPRIIYSGKLDHEGRPAAHLHDDIVMSLMMNFDVYAHLRQGILPGIPLSVYNVAFG